MKETIFKVHAGCIYQRDHLQNTCLAGSIKETIFKVHVWMDPSKRPSSKYMTWVDLSKRPSSKYMPGCIYQRDYHQSTCLTPTHPFIVVTHNSTLEWVKQKTLIRKLWYYVCIYHRYNQSYLISYSLNRQGNRYVQLV